MKFLFRADATQISGVGHIFRCLSLARALRDSGAETCFVVLDLPDYLASLLTQDGHTLKYLPEQVRDNPLADAAATLAGESSLTACILDHYHLGTDWEHYVQSQVDVLALDGAHALKLQTYTADTMTLNCNKPGFVIEDPESIWSG